MHLRIVETGELVTRRYVANRSHYLAMRMGLTENPQCPRNRTSTWNVRWPAIRAWGQYRSRNWIDGQPIRAAPKAPERKRLCRSRALSVDPCHFVALRSERRARRIDAAKRTREPQHE